MTARVTQQIVAVAYVTDPFVRVTAVAAEVLRTNSAGALPATTARPVVFVIPSG